MKNEITLKVGEMVVVQGSYHIKSIGIGSCAVIVMHDKKHKIAAVTHSMLPSAYDNEKSRGRGRVEGDVQYFDAKYINTTIPKMYAMVKKLGANKHNIKVKLVGGATMFKAFTRDNKSVGDNNITITKEMIEKLGLTINSDDTGGNHGRSVDFNTSNGVLNVNSRI